MENKLFTAIIFTADDQVLKYRNIKNYSYNENDFYNAKFFDFATSRKAKCINLYDKINKKFFKQIKLSTT